MQSRTAPASTPVPSVRETPISAGSVAAVAFETIWMSETVCGVVVGSTRYWFSSSVSSESDVSTIL